MPFLFCTTTFFVCCCHRLHFLQSDEIISVKSFYFYSYSLVFTRFFFIKPWELHKILVKLQVLKKINGFRNYFTPMCFGCLAWFSQKKCNTRTRKLKLSTNQSKKCNTAQKYHRNSNILNFQHMSTISFINFWTKYDSNKTKY